MKRFKTILFLWPVLVLVMVSNHMYSQDKKNDKKEAILEAITSQQYVFKAKTALPVSGRVRQLTSDYNLFVNKDSVIAYLPYFGRAYTAPIGNTNTGINFTSTDFLYKVTEGKKGGWIIEIKPKDQNEVRELILNISENGYGSLQVISNNRQAISFNGNIEPIEK